jgi:hypothetical protein
LTNELAAEASREGVVQQQGLRLVTTEYRMLRKLALIRSFTGANEGEIGMKVFDVSKNSSERETKQGGKEAMVKGAGKRTGAMLPPTLGARPMPWLVLAEKLMQAELGSVQLEQQAELAREGKQACAIEGQRIAVASPMVADNPHIMAHEAAHLVQQRGGARVAATADTAAVKVDASDPEQGAEYESARKGLAEPVASSGKQAELAKTGAGKETPTKAANFEAEADAAAHVFMGHPIPPEGLVLSAAAQGVMYQENASGAESARVDGVAATGVESELGDEAQSDGDSGSEAFELELLGVARQHAPQGTAMKWVAAVMGAESIAVDVEFVRSTRQWQREHGLDETGVIDHATLNSMSVELLAQSGKAEAARKWYKGNGAKLFKQAAALAAAPRDNAPPLADPTKQPIAAILVALEMNAGDAFTNLSEIADYKAGMKLDVTDQFLERALVWQIDQKLGFELDAQLGPSALVRMGVDPGEKFLGNECYASWNADNLESQEQDPFLVAAIADSSFFGGVIDTLTLGGRNKRSGDLTGDDGIAYGVAHFTGPDDLKAFLEFVSTAQLPSETDSAKTSGHALLDRHFGTGELALVLKNLLLDRSWGIENNLYLAALVEGGKVNQLLSFFRDPEIKRLQLEELRGDVEARVTTYRKMFDDGAPLTVGSAALIACLANSSNNGLGTMTQSGTQQQRQEAAGAQYLETEESSEYRLIAVSLWKEGLKKPTAVKLSYSKADWHSLIDTLQKDLTLTSDEAEEAKKTSGPAHRLRRLLKTLDTFGSTWTNPYQGTGGALQ